VTRARTLARAAFVFAVVLAADQLTKALVNADIARGDSVALLPGLDLVNTRNRGVAFGLLGGGGPVVVIVAVAVLTGLVVFAWRQWDRPLVWLPVGMLLGGAAGNLLDRVREGSVTDFVKLPAWPAFNVADIAITFGVLTLLYVLEGPPRRREATRRAAASADG
jgi:signal peptidase II